MLFEGLNCTSCTESQKHYRGCTTPAHEPFIYGDIEFYRCPVHEITEVSYFMIRMHTHYEKGFLLQFGGIINQPLKYLESMEVITSQLNECRKDKEEKEEEHSAAMDKIRGMSHG